MDNTFTKRLFFSVLFILSFLPGVLFAQTLSIGTVDAGPYGQGSSISVPIIVNDASGCIGLTNTYKLYLSDATGNFSPGTVIGTYTGFYAPFINGVIPATTPAGTGYKVRVTSSSPVVTSNASTVFTIKAVAGVAASATSDQTINAANPDVFGRCIGFNGAQFLISGTSPAGTTTTANFNNELSGNPEGTGVAIPTTGYTFTATTANYTVSIKSVDGAGTIGTKSYQLINNLPRTNLGSTGNGFACLINNKGDLSFNIDISSAGGGVQVNYPGNLYVLDWGDGSSTTYTFCQLKALNGVVTHTFTLPSCNKTGNGVANAFFVQNQVKSPYCGAINAPAGVSAKVLIVPVTHFTAPTTACVGTPLTLNNDSQPGPDPNNSTTPTCDNNPGTLYDWYVDNVKVSGSGYTLNQPLVLPATMTPGSHHIVLHTQLGGGYCSSVDFPWDICYEKPPQPVFTIQPSACQSPTAWVSPVDASIIDNTCPTSIHKYTWTVTGPAAVGYSGGTNANSTQPKFIFNTPGTYTVKLSINTTGCGDIPSNPQTINIDAAATANLSADVTLCNTNQTLTFDNTTGSITRTNFSGTTQPGASTYNWTVTGGAYSFAGGTNANSQYPKILFTDIATYTVSVSHTNSCNTATKSQKITFITPPTPVAGSAQTICSTGSAALSGSITGVYTSFQWLGGGGTFSAGRNALVTTYTPTAAEIAAGTVTLNLHAYNAGVPSPCADVASPITITITPLVRVNSPTTAEVCSGQAMSYAITADHTPATYSWAASATTGTPTGFTASGTSSTIADVLTNTGTADAVVTYKITPTYNTCPGQVFTLNVTVHPLPTITASSPTICNVQPTGIALASNVAGTSYKWTSVAQAGITGNTNPTAAATVSTIGDILTNSSVTTALTVTYTITPYNGTCAGTPVTAVVTVQPSIPSIPGPDKEICDVVYTLQGNNPSPGTGKWTVASGPPGVVFSDDTKANATVTGLIAGSVYKFTWTVSSLPTCTDAKTVTITVDNPPVAGTAFASPSTVCRGGTSFIKLNGFAGTITKWQSSIDGGTTWTDISNVIDSYTTPALTQNTTYRAVIHNGVCADVYPTADIVIVPLPVTADAGTDAVLCGIPPAGFSTLSYTLQGNDPAPGTGKWSMVSGPTPVQFDDNTKPNAVASNLTPGGTYVLEWKISGVTGSPCIPTTDLVTITIEKPPAGGTTNTAIPTVCSGANGTINLSGYFGTVTKWQSSTDGGSTWADISFVADTYPYTNLTVTTIFRAFVHNGTQCPDVPSAQVTVTVVPPVVPSNPGHDAVICGTVTPANPIISYTLQGNNPSPGTGKWTIKSGPTTAQFVDNTNPTTVVTNLEAGSVYEFQWEISGVAGSPCAPDARSVTITVEKPPVGGITTTNPSTVCTGASGNINLNGQFGTIIGWQSSTDGGTTWTDISFVGDIYPYTNLAQTTAFRAVIHNGTQCPDAYSAVTTVTVNPATVTANAGPNEEVCNATSYVLKGNDPSPGSGKWTLTSGQTGITFSDDSDPHATANNLQPGNIYTFQWTINGLPGCTMNNSTVTITNDEGPVGGIALGTTAICGGTTNGGVITLSGQSGTVVGWEKSVDGGNTWTAIASIADTYTYTNLTQSTQFRAILHKAGLCADVPSQPAIITIGQPAVISVPGADKVLCNVTTYTLQGNSPAPGTGLWTLDSGPAAGVNIANDTDPNAVVTGLTPGNTYTFRWTISGTAPCNPSSNVVKITIDRLPQGGNTSGAATVCIGDNHGSITLANQVGTVDHWEKSEDGGTLWQTIPSTNTVIPYDFLTQNTMFRAVVQSSSCGTAISTATTITVGQPAIPSVPGPNASICNTDTYTLQANNPAPGTGKWSIDAGPTAGVTFSDITKPNAVVSGLAAGNIYTFRWTITGSAGCGTTSNTVTIKIDELSLGGTTAGGTTYCAGPNAGQVTLSGQRGVVDHWEKSEDGGTNWVAIANTSISQSYAGLTQTTQYRAMVRNGTCPPVPSTVSTVTINPPTVVATAGTNQQLCNVTTYTLQGNNAGEGTGLWTVDAGPPAVTFSDIHDPNAKVSGMIAGNTYTFHWTITGLAPCGQTTSAVTIIIDKPSYGGTTAGSNAYCAGPNAGQITLSNQVGVVDHWEMSVNNGSNWVTIANTASVSILPYSGLTQTTEYRAIVRNGVCGVDPSSVSTITISPVTVTAVAGPNKELCSTAPYTMQGNDPGAGTGLWTVDAGPPAVTFSDAARPDAVVSGMQPGNTYVFHWTITGIAPCDPTSSPVTIIIDKPSYGGTTVGTTAYCTGPNAGQITLSNQVGTVDYWQKSIDNGVTWVNISNIGTILPYSGLTLTTQFRAMVHNGVCGQDPSSVSTITINPVTVTAVAGPNQELCSTAPYTMQGNNPGTGTGLWTVDGSPAGVTFSDATKPDAVVSGMQPGNTYVFHWTITGLAPCDPSSSPVTIVIDKPSYGGTTAGSLAFCAGPNGGQITLSDQVGTVDYWQRSTDNGTTWINIANTSTIQTYSGLMQTTRFRAMVHNGVCGQDPSSVSTITINPVTVTAVAGANQELCSTTTYTLQGNNPGAGTGLWTVDGSPAGLTFSDATNPNAVVSGMVAGNTYTFHWTITGLAPCDPSSSAVTIIIDETSVGGTTAGGTIFCAGPNGGQLTLSGQRGVVDHWEMSNDGGTNWANIINTSLTQPYANLTQTTQYRAMIRNGVCPPVPSSVSTITINPATVVAIAGPDKQLCNVTTYTMQANSAGAGTGLWTVDAGPPLVHFSDATDPHAVITDLIPGNTYNFHWTITGVAPCASNSSPVKITIDQLAIGGTTDGADVVCTGNNHGSITLTGQLGTIVRWEYSTNNGSNWQAENNTNNIYLYSNLTQTTQYRAIVSNGVCGEVQSTPTTITVGQPAIASVPGPDEAVCNATSYNLHANNPAPGTGKWTVLLGPPGATFSNDTDPNAIVSGLVPGNIYQFEWAITGSAGCAPNKRYVTITDDAPPIGGVTAGATTVCGGNNNGSVTLTGQFGTIVRWESSTNDGASWVKVDNETNILAYSNLTQTTKYRVLIHRDGKCADMYSDPTIITVNPPTVIANAGPDDEVCSVTTYKLQGNSAGAGAGKWTVASGPAGAQFTNDADPATVVTGLIPGSTYQFQWTITGLAPCGLSSDLVVLTIDKQAIGGTTAGAATVCAGDNKGEIALTGQFGTIIRWESSTDNGSSWQVINDVTVPHAYQNLTQTTRFRAILHIDGKCADAPSTATIITVNPQTVIADAGQDFTICNTSIAKLNGNSPGPSTGLWVQTAGPTVTIANPASYQTIVSGLAKGNVYTFKWTIKGLAPCADTHASVTIGAYEDVTPSFTKTEDHICGTSTVTFTNTSTPSPTGTFEWDFGDGTPVVTAVNPPSHTFVPSPDGREMTYTIRLTPTSNCGLKTPFTDVVKISPQKPVAALVPGQMSYCGTFSLSAKNMSPGENAEYDFYLKDATGAMIQHVRKTDTTTAVFQSITPAAPTVYSVYVVATDKCGNQGNSTPVNVSAAPSSLVSAVQIKGDVQSVCLGSPVTFQNISTGGDRFSISIYDASKKLIVALPSGTGDLNYTPKALGKYYVSIIAGSTGCGDAPASALREFTVSPTPQPKFTYTADNDYNVTFYNNTPDAGVAPASTINYSWDFGDGSARESTYIPKTHHYDITKAPYKVTLTATTPGTNCFDVYSNSVKLKFHGDLYMPNAFIPTSANRELNTYRVKGYGMKTWHMQIFNNFGQMIWETTKLDANGSPTEGWDGTYKGEIVQQGVYIWQVTATLLNGEDWRGVSMNGSTPSKTGPIHLIR